MKAVAGTDLDQRIAREVLGKREDGPVPPFSAEAHTASALAFEVSRQTGWKLHTSETRGIWSAAWIEDPRDPSSDPESSDPRRRKIGALVTASAPTLPLAICGALLKAARSPRWPGARIGRPHSVARSLAS